MHNFIARLRARATSGRRVPGPAARREEKKERRRVLELLETSFLDVAHIGGCARIATVAISGKRRKKRF